ncbi:MAG: lipid-A-disaccharide synthase N-terminal domain-containing protein [Flavobacterium sp.]|nr:lipid-A-disaccharide synthase N-terminal domain-containing protein [Pedobacter sp.]
MVNQIIPIIGLAAGVLTSASLLPQLIKTLKTKEAEDVSPYMFWMLVIGTSLWTYYGILRDDLPLTIFNAFSVTLNILMLVLRKRFKKS